MSSGLHSPTPIRAEHSLFSRPSDTMSRRVANPREEGLEADRELMLEDARSIREGLWRMARYAQEAAESLNLKMEQETLDGRAQAVEVREALEQLHALSLEVSEDLDVYQDRHGR